MEFAQRFDGVSWKIFVRLLNRKRKTGQYFKTTYDADGGILAHPMMNVLDEEVANDYG